MKTIAQYLVSICCLLFIYLATKLYILPHIHNGNSQLEITFAMGLLAAITVMTSGKEVKR